MLQMTKGISGHVDVFFEDEFKVISEAMVDSIITVALSLHRITIRAWMDVRNYQVAGYFCGSQSKWVAIDHLWNFSHTSRKLGE
jgi:hypothetical protein